MTILPSPASSPTIRTRQHLNSVVENIVLMRSEQAELERAQAKEIAAIRDKYRAPLAEVDRLLQMETAWVEAWAKQNPEEFSGERLLECPHAQIGFRMMPPRVERASRRWSWADATAALAETAWGQRYLRTAAPEIDKEAILADLANLPTEELRQAGIKIAQGERFFIEAHERPEESTNDNAD
jgi:phage host-nuclease inhibitor protein Gam